MDLYIPTRTPRYTPLPFVINDEERRKRGDIYDERPSAHPPMEYEDSRQDLPRDPEAREAYEISLV